MTKPLCVTHRKIKEWRINIAWYEYIVLCKRYAKAAFKLISEAKDILEEYKTQPCTCTAHPSDLTFIMRPSRVGSESETGPPAEKVWYMTSERDESKGNYITHHIYIDEARTKEFWAWKEVCHD